MSKELFVTPLHALHIEMGGKMVPFAGYDMPVQYALGVRKEHLHCRDAAGLFDVSHMGQVRLFGENAAQALEFRRPLKSSPFIEKLVKSYRNEVAFVAEDIVMYKEIKKTVAFLNRMLVADW